MSEARYRGQTASLWVNEGRPSGLLPTRKEQRMGGMRGRILFTWAALLVLGLSCAALAQQAVQVGPGQTQVQVNVSVQPVVQQVPATKGAIDWTNAVVEATGSGAPPTAPGFSEAQRRLMARRAAVVEAQRNLAETINGVHLTSYSIVQNFVLQDDTIRTTLEAFIQGARVVNERQLPDGSYEVVLRLGMYGPSSVSQATLPAVVQQARTMQQQGTVPPPVITIPSVPPSQAPQVPDEPSAPAAPGVPAPGGEVMAPPAPAIQVGPFTGLIVDCRGLGLSPAMSPKIADETGKEIWGTMQIDPEVAIEYGIVGYYKSVEDARSGSRAGQNPLVIKAIGKAGRAKMFQCDAVVTAEDGQRILRENAQTRFLEKLNVSFVAD